METGDINVKGTSQFDGTVDGISETGTSSSYNVITVTGGSTYTVQLSLSKANYECGAMWISSDSLATVRQMGGVVLFTTVAGEATASQSSYYSGFFYSKPAGHHWLSSPLSSPNNYRIVIQNVWIDNSVPCIKVTFYNTGATTKLEYYLQYRVWQT